MVPLHQWVGAWVAPLLCLGRAPSEDDAGEEVDPGGQPAPPARPRARSATMDGRTDTDGLAGMLQWCRESMGMPRDLSSALPSLDLSQSLRNNTFFALGGACVDPSLPDARHARGIEA